MEVGPGTLSELGDVALDAGDHAVARALYGESLTLFKDMSATKAILDRLYCFAVLAVAQAQPARALRLAGAADANYASLGEPPAGSALSRWKRQRATACQALSAEHVAAAWQDGQTMSLQQAMDYALDASIPPQPRPPRLGRMRLAAP